MTDPGMIIRWCRPDEVYKLHLAANLAFNYSVDIEKAKTESKPNLLAVGAFEPDGETLMAKADLIRYQTGFYGDFVPTVGFAGVATRPENRRRGCIREIMKFVFSQAAEQGWEMSYLYPFSFNYYRQFGYERLCDSLVLEVNMADLAFIPMDTNVRLYDSPELTEDLRTVYYAYAKDKNCIILAEGDNIHSHANINPHLSNRYTYIWYDPQGAPKAYMTYKLHGATGYDCMDVQEIIFSDAASLAGILGFLRTFDGQVKQVAFHRLPTDSPLLYMLRQFTNAKARIEFNAMGRVLNIEKLLERVHYEGNGSFSFLVEDFITENNRVFEVEYGNGKGHVTGRNTGAYDLALPVSVLNQIMLGMDNFDLQKASYLPGVKIENPEGALQLFRAFPKRSITMIEHF